MSDISDCCRWPVRVESEDEGTSFHVCTRCGRACDLKIETATCVKGYYSSTDVVKFSRPLVCYGGNGQPECDNLSVCRQANGMPPLTRAKCRYCGKTDPNIVCHGLPECGKIIPHHKHSYSIGHTCHSCNIEFGKGE